MQTFPPSRLPGIQEIHDKTVVDDQMNQDEESVFVLVNPQEVGVIQGTEGNQAVHILNLGLLRGIEEIGGVPVGGSHLIGVTIPPRQEQGAIVITITATTINPKQEGN